MLLMSFINCNFYKGYNIMGKRKDIFEFLKYKKAKRELGNVEYQKLVLDIVIKLEKFGYMYESLKIDLINQLLCKAGATMFDTGALMMAIGVIDNFNKHGINGLNVALGIGSIALFTIPTSILAYMYLKSKKDLNDYVYNILDEGYYADTADICGRTISRDSAKECIDSALSQIDIGELL